MCKMNPYDDPISVKLQNLKLQDFRQTPPPVLKKPRFETKAGCYRYTANRPSNEKSLFAEI